MRSDPKPPDPAALTAAGPVGSGAFISCHIPALPEDEQVAAAETAVKANPANAVKLAAAPAGVFKALPSRLAIAVMTNRYHATGQTFPVAFLEPTPAALRNRILATANRWRDRGANVRFAYTASASDAVIRLTRELSGYWSYLGTDNLHISPDQPTMCLQGWSLGTPDGEWLRVIPHEFGHFLGCPHEHMRPAIVRRIDPARAVAYFRKTQGWSAEMTRGQVLTALDERSLLGTPAEVDSVMAYFLPGAIMIDGEDVLGGTDITPTDAAFMARVYPMLKRAT